MMRRLRIQQRLQSLRGDFREAFSDGLLIETAGAGGTGGGLGKLWSRDMSICRLTLGSIAIVLHCELACLLARVEPLFFRGCEQEQRD